MEQISSENDECLSEYTACDETWWVTKMQGRMHMEETQRKAQESTKQQQFG